MTVLNRDLKFPVEKWEMTVTARIAAIIGNDEKPAEKFATLKVD
jgi:hypothetical protein